MFFMRISGSSLDDSAWVTRALSGMAALACWIMSAALYWTPWTLAQDFFLAYAVIYPLLWVLSKFWQYTPYLLYLALVTGMVQISALFGVQSGFQMMLLLLPAFGMLLFRAQNFKSVGYGVLLPGLAFLYLQIWGYGQLPYEKDLFAKMPWSTWLLNAFAFLAMFYLLLAFTRNRKEKQTIQELLETQHALNERLTGALALRSKFMTMVSHELRTPLHGISGGLSVLRREVGASTEATEALDILESASEEMRRMVESIIAVSELQGTPQLNFAEVELEGWIQSRVSYFKTLARSLNIPFVVDLAKEMPRVAMDGERLGWAFDALLDNAFKFNAGHLGIRVKIHTRRMDDDLIMRIVIADQGIGFDMSELPVLLEPFRQREEGLKRRYGGLGLGMVLASQGMQLMGGKIRWRSKPAHGTVAVLEVKLAVAPAKARPVVDSVALKGKVLVVEDNPINQKVLTKTLKAKGYEVLVAGDGAEGAEAFKSTTFDLVLMDLQMPVMDGFESMRAIRAWERDHAKPQTPIVVVSANSGDEEKERARQCGATGFFSKPLRWEEFQLYLGLGA
jgi:two-component system, sensor histidine kinase